MKISWNTLRVIREAFRGYHKHLFFLGAFGVVSAVLDGIGINAIVPLLSFLIGEGSQLPGDFLTNFLRKLFEALNIPFTFRFLLVFVGVLFILRALVLSLFAYVRARVAASFMAREAGLLMTKTLLSRWKFLAQQQAGYLQNTLYWDVKRSGILLDSVAQFIQSSTGFIIYIAIALSISPFITLITLGVGLVLLALLHPLVRNSVRLGEDLSRVEKRFSHHLIEHLGGLKSIKASGVGANISSLGKELLERFKDIYTKTVLVQSVGTSLIQPFSLVFIIVIFAIAYRLPEFNVAAFAATLYLIQKIFTYLQSTQASLHAIADQVPFAANIVTFKKQVETEQESISEHNRPFIFENNLHLKEVSLSYVPHTEALSNISAIVPRGAILGIVGPSGGGKTSVADLIMRLFTPSSGRILLDGIPIEEIKIEEWRSNVGYVSQDIFLINSSVRENIRFYDEEVTESDIERASKQAHIFEDILKLPQGFETVVGDRGITLSGGQRQRIVLARALARRPKLLILDEATSALDSESERAIQQAIEDIRGTVTIIIIAHRLATVMVADQIIVLEKGQITETGTPQELVMRPDSYLSRIYKLQTSSL